MSNGYLDTNVFMHALTHDEHAQECIAFLDALERGAIVARLDPLVMHELTYTLSRFAKQLSRLDVGTYLVSILEWPGVQSDKALLIDTVRRWSQTPGLSFVDAYLAAAAGRDAVPIYSKNVKELRAQGADVPNPLPRGTAR
jgi:predicted nucleic acid-binding protein